MTGQEEGRKDRPCAVVMAAKDGRVMVVPITTRKPDADTPALELPALIGKQLGLGDRPSWIVTDEFNVFRWPGEDIRPATRNSWSFGQLPPNFTKDVVAGVRSQRQRLRQVKRDQAPERVRDEDRSERRASLEDRLRKLAQPSSSQTPPEKPEASRERAARSRINRDDDRGIDR